MTLGEHLEELRRRLLYGLYGTGLSLILALFFGRHIVAWLCRPLAHALRLAQLPAQTITMTVMAGFTVYLKVSLIAAVVLAGPWILYQLWLFVAAGLYPHERRVVRLIWPFSAAMTGLGVLFAYYVLLPMALGFLIFFSTTFPAVDAAQPNFLDNISRWAARLDFSMWTVPTVPETETDVPRKPPESPASENSPVPGQASPPPTTPLPSLPLLSADPLDPKEGQYWINTSAGELRLVLEGRIRSVPLSTPSQNVPLIELNQYINFALYLILACVIAFQVPVVMLILAWTGLLGPQTLRPYRKYALFFCFVAGAVITPSGDPVNMTLLALPLYLLFELGLWVMRLAWKPPEENSHIEEQI